MTNTRLIRKIMRSHGKVTIWTNRLKNGNHTVKCNVYRDSKQKTLSMISDIRNALDNLNINYHVRTKSNSHWGWSTEVDSLIIEVPMN